MDLVEADDYFVLKADLPGLGGTFSRSLTLPDGVDPDKVEASFERGVLEVRIPKPEERKPRRISIGSADENGHKTIEGSTS